MQSKAVGVFNVAYGQRIAINELAKNICREIDSRSEIRHEAERVGDVKHSLAAVDKLRVEGFESGGNFDDGLCQTIDFLKKEAESKT
jgi:UDP-glucose 4-epimerase